MVDGEATAPQGPAASSIAIAEVGVPVVKVCVSDVSRLSSALCAQTRWCYPP
jgi:hypothetical protein